MKNIAILLSIPLFVLSSHAMTIDNYMTTYKSKNSLLKASELSYEATQDKLDAADLELAPVLTLGYLKGDDKSLPNQLSAHRTTEQYTAGLGKKFSTGTSVQLNGTSLGYENQGTGFPGFDKYSTGLLGVTVKQSLWKDFFGNGTRTRLERIKSSADLEMTSTDLQRRGLIMDAEFVFWDYVFAEEDLKLKKSNLERAIKLQKWTSQRLSNGIGEKADDLNSKALVSLRQLQLVMAENEYKNTEVKFRQNLDLAPSEKTPEVVSNWKEVRPYLAELRNKKNVIKIETYLSIAEAKTKTLAAEELTDSLRPDLSVFGTYNYTSYNREREESIKDMSRSDYPQSVIGVNFTWVMDQVMSPNMRAAADKEVRAQKLRTNKKTSDSQTSWADYMRNYEVTANQAKILEQVAELQKNRSNAETDRFAKGRTVTANVVTAETESAEAEANYLKAKVGLRKYEASSLMYMEWIKK